MHHTERRVTASKIEEAHRDYWRRDSEPDRRSDAAYITVYGKTAAGRFTMRVGSQFRAAKPGHGRVAI